MRSTIITSPVKNITNDTSNEIAAEENKDTITIDSEQENEIDRLLQW
ncbi:hypothetical protein [Clostridium saccharobutylicum]|nr:hypothetical protein [Clostridium saccharobutylicum]NYC29825.1 hypothetical protein [Clostridium saccharobutylicum]